MLSPLSESPSGTAVPGIGAVASPVSICFSSPTDATCARLEPDEDGETPLLALLLRNAWPGARFPLLPAACADAGRRFVWLPRGDGDVGLPAW